MYARAARKWSDYNTAKYIFSRWIMCTVSSMCDDTMRYFIKPRSRSYSIASLTTFAYNIELWQSLLYNGWPKETTLQSWYVKEMLMNFLIYSSNDRCIESTIKTDLSCWLPSNPIWMISLNHKIRLYFRFFSVGNVTRYITIAFFSWHRAGWLGPKDHRNGWDWNAGSGAAS